MPSRVLREGILDSDAVNRLSFEAEVFYRRLMSVVDDYGRFDGRPPILIGRLYPLKIPPPAEADIVAWVTECEAACLVTLYRVNRKPYLLMHNLGEPRAKKPKYPDPPPDVLRSIGVGSVEPRDPYTGRPLPPPPEPPPPPPEPEGPKAKRGRRVKGEKTPKVKADRPRNLLFDAVAEVTGSDVTVTRGLIGKLSSLLGKAEPPYTPDDVREFGRRFHEFCPWAADDGRDRPTLGELGKAIGLLRAPRPQGGLFDGVGRTGRVAAPPGKYADRCDFSGTWDGDAQVAGGAGGPVAAGGPPGHPADPGPGPGGDPVLRAG